MEIFTRFIAFLNSIILFIAPCLNYSPKADDIKLNAAIISDTHIDTRLPCGKLLLKRAFKDMNGSAAATDAVIVTGDLTNYGDNASVKDFFEILTETTNAKTAIVAMGNHEIGHTSDLGLTNAQARADFLENYNNYLGTSFEKNYYSYVINGYKFIVLCDDSEDNWDCFEIHDEQLAFLDRELADGSASGLPVFVICHEPVEGVNGQPIVYKDGAIDSQDSAQIKAILEKYSNVFFISGHLHEGINGELTEKTLGFKCVETLNGVTYVNLPTYLLINRYGIPWNGLGMQMEVYENSVIFRTRNYMTSKWYSAYEFEVPLV